MNAQDTVKITEVANGTEIYQEGVFTSTEVIELPPYLPWTEFVCLLLVVVFGLGLYIRRRQACVLLLPLGALLLAASLAWVLGDLPAVAHWYAAGKALQALAHMLWLRPVGALLLAIYALMQWREAGKREG